MSALLIRHAHILTLNDALDEVHGDLLSVDGRIVAVEKVADLNFVAVDGVGFGGYEPLARVTQAGANLWFTTDKGGTFDAGLVNGVLDPDEAFSDGLVNGQYIQAMDNGLLDDGEILLGA